MGAIPSLRLYAHSDFSCSQFFRHLFTYTEMKRKVKDPNTVKSPKKQARIRNQSSKVELNDEIDGTPHSSVSTQTDTPTRTGEEWNFLSEGVGELLEQNSGVNEESSSTSSLKWPCELLPSHVGLDREKQAIEITLRNFDLSATYGPSRGISRVKKCQYDSTLIWKWYSQNERYQRAVKLGLNPPQIIKEILDT